MCSAEIFHVESQLVFLRLQVPFSRSSLNHDDIFILDTKDKIYQFNGANSNIQERAKALEVIQFLKDKYHEGTCDVAIVGECIHDFGSCSSKCMSIVFIRIYLHLYLIACKCRFKFQMMENCKLRQIPVNSGYSLVGLLQSVRRLLVKMISFQRRPLPSFSGN